MEFEFVWSTSTGLSSSHDDCWIFMGLCVLFLFLLRFLLGFVWLGFLCWWGFFFVVYVLHIITQISGCCGNLIQFMKADGSLPRPTTKLCIRTKVCTCRLKRMQAQKSYQVVFVATVHNYCYFHNCVLMGLSPRCGILGVSFVYWFGFFYC